MQPLYWLILFIILLIIEVCTMGLTTIWFAGGSIFGLLVSYFGGPLWLQIALFLIVSLLLFFLTRPVALRYFNRERTRTNADSLIGYQGMVTEEINTLKATGRVQVKGQEWSARTQQVDEIIEKDKVVRILDIKGVKLIVKEEE